MHKSLAQLTFDVKRATLQDALDAITAVNPTSDGPTTHTQCVAILNTMLNDTVKGSEGK